MKDWIIALKEKYPHLDFDGFADELSTFTFNNEREEYTQGILSALSRTNTTDIAEFIGLELGDWIKVAAELQIEITRKEVLNYGTEYLERLILAVSEGLLSDIYITKYSVAEIQAASDMIDYSRDALFDYAGIKSLYDRYLLRTKDGKVVENPQERFLNIALYLMQNEEKSKRMQYVADMYRVLSKLEVTVATPTLANAGKPNAQLASCQILTTEDSLRSIYDDNTDAASFSKHGAGLGIYVGKLRASASSIRGHKGVSSGIIPWIKNLDNTAVAVNQLGVRNGAIAVFTDIWHKDILDFLDLRLNTGDQSKRAHNIFPGVCIPDIFWRRVKARAEFTLFDPYEVTQFLGNGEGIEDYYDEYLLEDGQEPDEVRNAFSFHYLKLEAAFAEGKISGKKVAAIDIIRVLMRAAIETGIPYMMNRDTVNRANPNKHKGMIYSSNLCTEILQNQSPTIVVKEEITDLGDIITTKRAGDLVTCNLASLVLNRIYINSQELGTDFYPYLGRIIKVMMRGLDNVVELNTLPVAAARITNQKYRAVGAGQQGIAALLAYCNIPWDSDDATNFIGKLQEEIHYNTIQASAELSEEKGAYPYFVGSEWGNGGYFESRQLDSERWIKLREYVHNVGVRNGYMLATAPTGTTGIIAGSTPSVDPIFDHVYREKKKGIFVPVVVPNLNFETLPYYKNSASMEYDGQPDLAHMWAIRHNAARQRHIDQTSSFNVYIPDDIRAVNLLKLYLTAWEMGIKTTYYTRVKTRPIGEDCVACSA